MARRVFFSFNYDDVADFKVNVVRNSRALKNPNYKSTFIDKSLWEEARKKNPSALKQLMDSSLNGTSVTVILIGDNTANRRWVNYEIIKSFVEGKGITAIHLNRIRSKSTGKISSKGVNPLSRIKLRVDNDCAKIFFYELVDGKWLPFKDIPSVNNRKSNSFWFSKGGFWKRSNAGEEFRFSELFESEYCWISDDGYNNLPNWIEKSAQEIGR